MSNDPIEFPKSRKAAACPVCGRPPVPEAKPFCSKRCADVDLARWLNGVYRVPAVEQDDEAEEADPEKFAPG
ncbi:DNA gyrase inhibitor YacG [Indioceanicola profundi]|uniref:DNA gyrase inhibitor YacG n=1 Tax=Indioceanicola profundi TaxID=2220096 RepID=UPI000E6AC1E0|nr:DNA gyrase inhibitor YacG [Indioceanicola profundi]